jgi:hypothetical protein
MATYAVTVEASVLVEANNAIEAFGKVDSILAELPIDKALNEVGKEVYIDILEPEKQ